LWSFPGAETISSTDQNPQNIVYNTPGIYEVSLIATNSFGSDILIKSCYIEVEQATYAKNEKDLLDAFKLFQNFPNPFNPKTTISWRQPSESKVTIKVFDVLGKEITTIFDEVTNTGFHQINFDGNWLPSGIYFYQITAENFNQIRKMVLLR
jgi:PKD repeat protein